MRFLASLLAVLLLIAACRIGSAVTPSPTGPTYPPPSAVASILPTASPLAIDPSSGLRFVNLADLPPEATHTVELINSGGPFPYSQDGVVFQNREGILPDESTGYYHEFTVKTPGSTDRGARRIVTGEDGAMYYTGDHYASFVRIRDE